MATSNIPSDNYIELSPDTTPKATVIWLHGLGADGADFVPIVPELHLPSSLAIRFIFPHAPIMPVTINGGYEMRAWFDIYGAKIDSKIDEAGMAGSVAIVQQLIAQEVEKGIATENIILAGFSQGAVIALQTGLCYPKPLAGILALSGYLPNAASVLQGASEANRSIPIFIAHGTEDTIVPHALGQATRMGLEQAGYAVSWHSYPMAHSVCGEEIGDISAWLQRVAG